MSALRPQDYAIMFVDSMVYPSHPDVPESLPCAVCNFEGRVKDVATHWAKTHVKSLTVAVDATRTVELVRDKDGRFECPLCRRYATDDARSIQVGSTLFSPSPTSNPLGSDAPYCVRV